MKPADRRCGWEHAKTEVVMEVDHDTTDWCVRCCDEIGEVCEHCNKVYCRDLLCMAEHFDTNGCHLED